MVYRPNFDLCAFPSKKVVKHDSSEKQRCVLHFKGHFEWFEAILADNTLKCQKHLKMSFFGKTPG